MVELDGEIHDDTEVRAHDAKHEEYLRARQRVVVRFANREVMEKPDHVLQKIAKLVAELKSPTADPSAFTA